MIYLQSITNSNRPLHTYVKVDYILQIEIFTITFAILFDYYWLNFDKSTFRPKFPYPGLKYHLAGRLGQKPIVYRNITGLKSVPYYMFMWLFKLGRYIM